MVINALNSGANCYMADFEDSTAPTWARMVEGQRALRAAVAGTLAFTSDAGKAYAPKPFEQQAVLIVRPRGWHLDEKHRSEEKTSALKSPIRTSYAVLCLKQQK